MSPSEVAPKAIAVGEAVGIEEALPRENLIKFRKSMSTETSAFFVQQGRRPVNKSIKPMNYYKQQNQSVRRAKLIRGIKIVCWCIAVVAIIGVIGNDEFTIKLALGIL